MFIFHVFVPSFSLREISRIYITKIMFFPSYHVREQNNNEEITHTSL